ncbi:MAG: hypothetical protein KDK70_31965 [Myxococcales bacterium]|nr:hypothetical protein [Myxococcales bacterium]
MMMRWCQLGLLAIAGCEINPAFDPDALAGSGSGSGSGGLVGPEGEPGVPLPDPCPALPQPAGAVITVEPSQAAELPGIVGQAPAGSTVVLAPGTYPIDRSLYFNAPDVTLRSSTGRPEDVIIDGQRLAGTVAFVQQPRITLAEVTLARAQEHLVHVSGSEAGPADGVVGYRLRLLDPGAIAFKINPTAEGQAADDGVLACSTIELTDAGRAELGDACPSVAGVGGFGAFGWTIRDNHVEGIWCETGYAGSAIRFLETSAHTVVLRNSVRDCVSGIMLGLWEDLEPRRTYDDVPCGDGYFDHVGGLVANNTVVATGTGIAASEYGLDTGVGLWNVCDATVVHNTVVSAVATYNAIEYRFGRTQARVVNNLVTNEILDRDDAGVPVAGNALVDLGEFVDPLGGDVHLVEGSSAIDAGIQLGEDAVLHDIDGDPRDARPDIGADER